jgi:cellulase/cellobiase CelA1
VLALKKVYSAVVVMILASSYLVGLELKITIKKDWGHGFCADVTVYNETPDPKVWEVSFDPQGKITTLWSGTYLQNPSTLMTTVRGLAWNEIIKSKTTRTFGYCAKRLIPPKAENGEL